MAKYKQRNRTNPQRISFEALNEGLKLYLIGASTKQRMLRLFQFNIAIMLPFLLSGYNTHRHEKVTI